MKSEFRDTLLKATDPQVVVDTINAAAAPASTRCRRRASRRCRSRRAAAAAAPRRSEGDTKSMKFVGVTSCPTGIAHTYMAAEALEQAAKAAGHEIVDRDPGLGRLQEARPRGDRRR